MSDNRHMSFLTNIFYINEYVATLSLEERVILNVEWQHVSIIS